MFRCFHLNKAHCKKKTSKTVYGKKNSFLIYLQLLSVHVALFEELIELFLVMWRALFLKVNVVDMLDKKCFVVNGYIVFVEFIW